MSKSAVTSGSKADGAGRRVSKKDLAVTLYQRGTQVEAIAAMLDSTPSYVANSLIERGFVPDYSDLYTTTSPATSGGRPVGPYAEVLAGVLRFKDLAAAQASVARLSELHLRFAQDRDRRGMHQCQVLALIGEDRAEGIGKPREARLFAAWLAERLLSEAA